MPTAREQILIDELTNDPLGRGYSGMTDKQAAADLNTEYRTQDRARITGADLLNATVRSEYVALSAAERELWHVCLLMPEIHLDDANTRALLAGVWDGGTTTRANLVALQSSSISRARELGLGRVKSGHVQIARAL